MIEKLFAMGLLPEALIRRGIRWQLADRLKSEAQKDKSVFIADMAAAPLALKTDSANSQHYEVPSDFFGIFMGKHRKYSCCLWPEEALASPPPPQKLAEDLDGAELAMLELTAKRAGIRNGDKVLDLGCGWGAFCLFAAEKFPESSITAVSNSASQKAYIDSQAALRGLRNLTVITQDINHLSFDQPFDRIVSVEMFEHMRNYRLLLNRVASWLKPDGELFVHIFVHKRYAYPMDDESNSWMARHFFSGGMFPSYDIFSYFTEDITVKQQWPVNGNHYALTCEAWHRKCLSQKKSVLDVFGQFYGLNSELSSLERLAMWRMFFLACAELFAWQDGGEWFVGHYLLGRS